MRTYHYHVYARGDLFGNCGWQIETNTRIRQLALELYREHFGAVPHQFWHKDGSMAEAWTGRYSTGFRVEVIQINLINQYIRYACPICGQRLRLKFVYHANGARGRSYWLCPALDYGCDSATDDHGYLRPAYNRAPHPRRLLTFNHAEVA